MTPADIGHEFARWGPFLLVIAWGALVSLLRRRPPRPVEPPAPPRVVQRPLAVARWEPSPAPLIPPPPSPPAPRPAPAPEPVPLSVPACEEAPPRLPAAAWRQAIVVTEVLGPPVALRRPGTLGPPGAF